MYVCVCVCMYECMCVCVCEENSGKFEHWFSLVVLLCRF